MDFFKNMNLTIEQQRQLIVWLSGVYGLLVGIISMFFIELRIGIDTWLHLAVILTGVAVFVLMCNAVVKWYIHKKQDMLGSVFWTLVIFGIIFLVIIASALAFLI